MEIVMKEEILLLEVWKKYWVLLNCVDILIVLDIEWFVVF
ncbi:tail fiber assembly protein, partial [Streptococcus pyogenes]